MKILYVIDMYDQVTNGMTVSARAFMSELRDRGHEVRFLCASDKPEEFKYCLPAWDYKFVHNIMQKLGAVFAGIDLKVIAEALDGVDVVHTFMSFKLSKVVYEMASAKGIPVIAAFHVQPENISYNFSPLRIIPGIDSFIYRHFRQKYYRFVKDIHCPTQFIANLLVKHKYKAKMHVISNGVSGIFTPGKAERPTEWGNRFTIACVGRMSPEKRQNILMKAISKSKYCDKIQLVLCGVGPRDNWLKKLAKKLNVNTFFGYYTQSELLKILRAADLYVQPSKVEIECISCLEAFSTGLVPIIADSRLSAARYFAIDERSLFKVDDHKDLTKKIEYFMEHPEAINELKKLYIEKSQNFTMSKSVDKIMDVYNEVISRGV